MSTRLVPALLIALLLVVHGQLWFGRGSVGNVSDMQRKLEAEVAELDKYVPRSSIPQDVQAQVVSLRRNPAFANKTVLECYEIVVGKKVRKPSPPTFQKVSSARTTSPA